MFFLIIDGLAEKSLVAYLWHAIYAFFPARLGAYW
jgi:hypothetical protein